MITKEDLLKFIKSSVGLKEGRNSIQKRDATIAYPLEDTVLPITGNDCFLRWNRLQVFSYFACSTGLRKKMFQTMRMALQIPQFGYCDEVRPFLLLDSIFSAYARTP